MRIRDVISKLTEIMNEEGDDIPVRLYQSELVTRVEIKEIIVLHHVASDTKYVGIEPCQ